MNLFITLRPLYSPSRHKAVNVPNNRLSLRLLLTVGLLSTVLSACSKKADTILPANAADLLIKSWQVNEISGSGNKGQGSTLTRGTAAYNNVFDNGIEYTFLTGGKATLLDDTKTTAGTWKLLNNSQLEITVGSGTDKYIQLWDIKSLSASNLDMGVTINAKNQANYDDSFSFLVAAIATALGVDDTATEVSVNFKLAAK